MHILILYLFINMLFRSWMLAFPLDERKHAGHPIATAN